MSLCCIGGVCVPTSAVWAVLALCLRWILEKVVRATGWVPPLWLQKLGVPAAAVASGKCCNGTSSHSSNCTTKQPANVSVPDDTVKPADMPHITDEDDWKALLSSSSSSSEHTLVVAKMTATWCKPCQQIQPTFGRLATQYAKSSAAFCTVDVDDCDEVAASFNVAMMPTFLIVNKADGNVVDRYAGSDAQQLSNFLAQHLAT